MDSRSDDIDSGEDKRQARLEAGHRGTLAAVTQSHQAALAHARNVRDEMERASADAQRLQRARDDAIVAAREAGMTYKAIGAVVGLHETHVARIVGLRRDED